MAPRITNDRLVRFNECFPLIATDISSPLKCRGSETGGRCANGEPSLCMPADLHALTSRDTWLLLSQRERRSLLGVGHCYCCWILWLPCIWFSQPCNWSSSFVLTSRLLGSCWQISTRIAGSPGWAGALHQVQRTRLATRVYV